MRELFLLLFFSIFSIASAQLLSRKQGIDTITVKNTNYVIRVKAAYSKEYPSHKDTLMFFGRIDKGKEKLLLVFKLYSWSADCNNEFTDIGTAEIKNNQLVLFTEFHQKGNDPIPENAKKVYKFTDNGKLILIKSM